MAASNGSVRVVAKITISAKPPAVFNYLTDLRRHFLWNPHLRTISPLIKLESGSVYETSSIILGVKVKGKNEVTRLKPEQELQIENHTGLIRYAANYKLGGRGGQTTITCTTTVDTEYKPLHFADSIMKKLARRELQSD